MARPSKVKQLPSEIREKIGELRRQGCTIDQILEVLDRLNANISRSGLGRHIKQHDELEEELLQSRRLAEELTSALGTSETSRSQILNIELMHSAIMKLFVNKKELDTKDITFIASALKNLAGASKDDLSFRLTIEKEIREKFQKEAKSVLEKAQNQGGISQKAADFLTNALSGASSG